MAFPRGKTAPTSSGERQKRAGLSGDAHSRREQRDSRGHLRAWPIPPVQGEMHFLSAHHFTGDVPFPSPPRGQPSPPPGPPRFVLPSGADSLIKPSLRWGRLGQARPGKASDQRHFQPPALLNELPARYSGCQQGRPCSPPLPSRCGSGSAPSLPPAPRLSAGAPRAGWSPQTQPLHIQMGMEWHVHPNGKLDGRKGTQCALKSQFFRQFLSPQAVAAAAPGAILPLRRGHQLWLHLLQPSLAETGSGQASAQYAQVARENIPLQASHLPHGLI